MGYARSSFSNNFKDSFGKPPSVDPISPKTIASIDMIDFAQAALASNFGDPIKGSKAIQAPVSSLSTKTLTDNFVGQLQIDKSIKENVPFVAPIVRSITRSRATSVTLSPIRTDPRIQNEVTCKSHGLRLDKYCLKCSKICCSECAFTPIHSDHKEKIQLLSETQKQIHTQLNTQQNQNQTKIDRNVQQLQEILKQIHLKKETLKEKYEAILGEIASEERSYLEMIKKTRDEIIIAFEMGREELDLIDDKVLESINEATIVTTESVGDPDIIEPKRFRNLDSDFGFIDNQEFIIQAIQHATMKNAILSKTLSETCIVLRNSVQVNPLLPNFQSLPRHNVNTNWLLLTKILFRAFTWISILK
jgi:hypothetical protein